MTQHHSQNPLLAPLRRSFDVKRSKSTGLVPRNWLLITLRIVDMLRDRDTPIAEDEIYSYDFTLKKSRTESITRLLSKYAFPTNLGLSKEGVTVRGAPGFRMFREIEGGAVLMPFPAAQRDAFILETVECIREELSRVLEQKPVELPTNVFQHTGKLIPALLNATTNRSNGRVEQALVGAKLQVRFPQSQVAVNVSFAGDRQTRRECDYEVGNIRVVVSVSPSPAHFASAKLLADEGREVYLVVSDGAFASARTRIKREGYEGLVTVQSVADYVVSNMKETGHQLELSAQEMCARLVAEYNRRIGSEYDQSLRIVVPDRVD